MGKRSDDFNRRRPDWYGDCPSQAPVETILKVDLYGTAVLLEEVGKIIKQGGVGVTIFSQSGWRMPALTVKEDELLATTPTEELLAFLLTFPQFYYMISGAKGHAFHARMKKNRRKKR